MPETPAHEADPNRAMVAEVARALGDLREEVVFVGGAVVGLLFTDVAAPQVRRTEDVDVIVEVVSYAAYVNELSARLRARGFSEAVESVICRWRLGSLQVDVMPTDPEPLKFSNRWYPGALETSVNMSVGGVDIRIVNAPYFLATKLVAFQDRGKGDFAASHDLEDALAVVNARPEVLDEIRAASWDVRAFLATEFGALLDDEDFINVLEGHVERGRDEHVRDVLGRISALG